MNLIDEPEEQNFNDLIDFQAENQFYEPKPQSMRNIDSQDLPKLERQNTHISFLDQSEFPIKSDQEEDQQDEEESSSQSSIEKSERPQSPESPQRKIINLVQCSQSPKDESQYQLSQIKEVNEEFPLFGNDKDKDTESPQKTTSILKKKKNLPKVNVEEQGPQRLDTLRFDQFSFDETVLSQTLDVESIKKFLFTPVPEHEQLLCSVRREKNGITKLFPKYYVHLSNSLRFLVSAKKRSKNCTSNYLISLSKENMRRNDTNYIGKVRSNFIGSEFLLFDSGENPSRCQNLESIRTELCAYLYENSLIKGGPRKMTVLHEQNCKKPLSRLFSIIERYKRKDPEVQVYVNKLPVWNQKKQCYFLDFGGRITCASVKNFQLTKKGGSDVVVQFGKVQNNIYNLDVGHPFSLIQALGIVLSVCDNKLACD